MNNWEQNEQILSRINLVLLKEQQLLTLVESINVPALTQTLKDITHSLSALTSEVKSLSLDQESLGNQLSNISAGIKQILNALIPPPAVSCIGTITLDQPIGEKIMTNKAAKVAGDLAVADNGTFTGTLTFKDADGVTTSTPAGLSVTNTSSDASPGPSIFDFAAGPSGDQSTFAGTVDQTTVAALVAAGTPLPTGLTISFSATWTGLASPVTGTYAPNLDVVPGPAATAVAVVSEP